MSETQQEPPVLREGNLALAAGITGNLPPHDTDAEASVLSAVLCDPARLAEISHILEAKHFYSDANHIIYDGILAIDGMSMPIDLTTLAHHLRAENQLERVGGASYLGQIIDATPAIANIEAHARIVEALWRARRMISETMATCALGYGLGSHAEHVNEYINTTQERIFSVGEGAASNNLVHVGDCMDELSRQIDAVDDDIEFHGIHTGWKSTDKMFRLGIGNVTYIGARPGMGKTAFALGMSLNIAAAEVPEGDELNGVGIFSMEQPKEQLIHRMCCQVGGANLGKLIANEGEPLDKQRWHLGRKMVAALPIWVDDTAGLSLARLRSKVRRMAQKAHTKGARLRIVVIDYVQLMKGRGIKGQSRDQELGEISRGLKEMAKEMGLHFVVICQLNRGVESRSPPIPMLSDLRECGSFEQDADAIVLLYRPEYYANLRADFPMEECDRGMVLVILGKYRHGATDAVRMAFIGSCVRFADMWQKEEAA